MTKAEIQFVRSLADKRTRDEERLFIAEGKKLIDEIEQSKLTIRRIYTTRPDFTGSNVEVVDKKTMERITQLKTASDSLAIVEQPRHRLDNKALKDKLTLALDGVQNPGNLGTIIRLADWFGIENIICSTECADLFNPKVVQATMGAISRVKVHYLDLAELIKRNPDIPVYGTFLDGRNIYETSLTPHGIVVMGNEGQGISDEIGRLIKRRLFIPSYPQERPTSESLNVGMATAITVAEFRRRI